MIDEGILLGALYNTTQTKLTCTSDGKLRVDAVATIAGAVDISDKPTRQLGLVYGSQGEQLLQRAASFDLEVQLRTGGAEYDARQIRSLAKATDEVYGVLRTDAGAAYDSRDRNWNLGALDVPDLSDRWARQVGQFDLARVLGAALTSANPIIAGIFDAAGNRMPSMDAAARPGYLDMIDRAGRLAGIVYGNVGQLQQRAVSGDAYVQVRSAGAEIDPRSIRALTKATDEVYSALRTDAGVAYDARDRNWTLGATDVPDLSDRAARSVGRVDFPITNPVASQLIGAATYGLGIGLFDAAGDRMPSMDAAARPGYVDVIDRAARLLGTVSPVAASVWDVSDRAARLLGKIYGDQGVFTQRATSLDAQVQLRTAGTEYDARQIRALTSADAVDVSDRAARLLGTVSPVAASVWDVSDRAGRLLGIAYGESAQLQQGAGGDAYANPANALEALDFLMGWNSASWDRIRTVDALANAAAGAGVTLKNYHNDELGILPSVALGYDDTLNANAFRAVAVDASGRLEVVTV